MYKRDDAVGYAQAHWNIPCHDKQISRHGVPALDVEAEWKKLHLSGHRSDWKAEFRQDTFNPNTGKTETEVACFVRWQPAAPDDVAVFQGWAGLADCAHFMSCCLQKGTAAIPQTDGVPGLVKLLHGLPNTKTLAAKVSAEQAQRIIDLGFMKKGDVICYFDYTGRELDHKKDYIHSAMFVSSNTVSCHTKCRWDKPWRLDELDPHYTYTLIHFSDDDPAPPPPLTAALRGWWAVSRGGVAEYWYYEANGKVSYTTHRPRHTSHSILHPEGTGYWFHPQGLDWLGSCFPTMHLICWTDRGHLDWTAFDPQGNLFGFRNFSDRFTGTRM
jgi:hypothetical protein